LKDTIPPVAEGEGEGFRFLEMLEAEERKGGIKAVLEGWRGRKGGWERYSCCCAYTIEVVEVVEVEKVAEEEVVEVMIVSGVWLEEVGAEEGGGEGEAEGGRGGDSWRGGEEGTSRSAHMSPNNPSIPPSLSLSLSSSLSSVLPWCICLPPPSTQRREEVAWKERDEGCQTGELKRYTARPNLN
jgi:hypothetical protein